MAKKRSKTVQNIISDMYAKMAQVAGRQAIKKLEREDDPLEADIFADWAVVWFDKAGANASKWRGV